MPRKRQQNAQGPSSRRSKRQSLQHNTYPDTSPGMANDRAIFSGVWRILRSAGWISKPPQRSRLSDLYRYVPPGGNIEGLEGTDFFLGERSLLEYYRRVTIAPELVEDSAVSVVLHPTTDSNATATEHTVAETSLRSTEDQSVPESQSHALIPTLEYATTPAGSVPMSELDISGNDVSARTDIEAEEPASAETGQAICAVCMQHCSSERGCTWCKKFIHHFCSHDICVSLNLPDGEGGFRKDFGDYSYCSKQCYTSAKRSDVLDTSGIGIGGHDCSTNYLQDSSMTGGPTITTVVTTKSVKKRMKSQTPTSAPATAKSISSKSKGKAPHKKNKAMKEASVMKEELLRRAHLAAEKFVDANVAFSPVEEDWMTKKFYKGVGSSYLMGVVTRYFVQKVKIAENVSVPSMQFQVQWTSTGFQSNDHVHRVSEEIIVRGIRQFTKMNKAQLQFGESWTSLCGMVPKMSNIPALTDEFEEMDEQGYKELSTFRGQKELHIPLNPREVEQINSMTFSPTAALGQPPGLYTHSDGTWTTRLREHSRNLFGHSATSSFFAFIPLSFWSQVVVCSNMYADTTGNPAPRAITLDELMKFLGILWYMTLVDKGEMRNYWIDEDEAAIFPGGRAISLDSIMTWRRFLYIRTNLSFRSSVTTSDVQRDPAARIRPLINILKSRCLLHVDVGRNVVVDEASIACRSRYARHIIVFNSHKPTGKYHFKLYACCCSTSWFVLSFKLHCTSTLDDRLEGVVSNSDIHQLAELTAESSEVRTHVIEVTASLAGSNLIVNTDNFYTSCLLLESLRSIGLYGRGTVRAASKHFPHFTMIQKSDAKPRGFMKQGVCVEKHIVAASWVDGSIVNVVSNADASTQSIVYRRVKDCQVGYKAPTCVQEYNSAMQGVDRHDQLRGRFSLADGHSFQKWHKKLAMAMIDIARCNAYICDRLARGYHGDGNESTSRTRDPHRTFVVSLIRELFNGEWKKSLENDCGMAYTVSATSEKRPPNQSSSTAAATGFHNLPQTCVAKESWKELEGRSRSKRKCTVCSFECRNATQKTDYCSAHNVALCKRSYPGPPCSNTNHGIFDPFLHLHFSVFR